MCYSFISTVAHSVNGGVGGISNSSFSIQHAHDPVHSDQGNYAEMSLIISPLSH